MDLKCKKTRTWSGLSRPPNPLRVRWSWIEQFPADPGPGAQRCPEYHGELTRLLSPKIANMKISSTFRSAPYILFLVGFLFSGFQSKLHNGHLVRLHTPLRPSDSTFLLPLPAIPWVLYWTGFCLPCAGSNTVFPAILGLHMCRGYYPPPQNKTSCGWCSEHPFLVKGWIVLGFGFTTFAKSTMCVQIQLRVTNLLKHQLLLLLRFSPDLVIFFTWPGLF